MGCSTAVNIRNDTLRHKCFWCGVNVYGLAEARNLYVLCTIIYVDFLSLLDILHFEPILYSFEKDGVPPRPQFVSIVQEHW